MKTITVDEYITRGGHGTLAQLARDSRVSIPTIKKAQAGEVVSLPCARAIGAATGGRVSWRRLAGV